MGVFVVISTMTLAAITLVAVAVDARGIPRIVLVLATAASALLSTSVNTGNGQSAWLIYPILAVSIPAAIAVFRREIRPKMVINQSSPMVFVPKTSDNTSSWGWRESVALAVWICAIVAVSVLTEGAPTEIRVLLGVVAFIPLLLLIFFLIGRREDPDSDESESV